MKKLYAQLNIPVMDLPYGVTLEYRNGMGTVSYTHLDVYKRQVLSRIGSGRIMYECLFGRFHSHCFIEGTGHFVEIDQRNVFFGSHN